MSTWIRFRADHGSSHLIRNWSRVPGRALTLCGRVADGPTSDSLPAGRSCESCLRAMVRIEEAPPSPDDQEVPA